MKTIQQIKLRIGKSQNQNKVEGEVWNLQSNKYENSKSEDPFRRL